ncbi:MAG: hypothetical protein HY921_00790 [Elusimicrobia bacterium]|nr:hypothetical protein [Elusimicrobiota bacterium]
MIVRCPHCAAQVDEEAAHCPSCSWDFENKRKAGEPPPVKPPAAVQPIKPEAPPERLEEFGSSAPGDAAERFKKSAARPEVVLAPSSEKAEARAESRRNYWKIYAATLAILTALSLAVFYYTTISETPVSGPAAGSNPFKTADR